ncbi:anti-sigma factor [Anditalea andensis]|uniref:Anti-sigma-K factor RskA n=1 Tax=Anditalea andensis TaxID=1048983 RepID=A0A074L391_9BACT|nr:anti-sigma factor [Anditalea andensis]KEO74348.1 anti-sigma-K factor RskA [Anditalea andensis]
MDIQSYISSGKLELFVLGELSEREREEVIRLAAKYPAINEELRLIEEAILAFDNKSGASPSEAVKNKIFESWEDEQRHVLRQGDDFSDKSSSIVALQPWKNFAIAASIAAIIASVFAIYYANRYFDVEGRYMALVQDQAVMAEELDAFRVNIEQAEVTLETLLAGEFSKVPVRGESFEVQTDANVVVWWEQSSAQVYVSVENLSPLGDDRDYQLWAIGDDGPIGIGLINPGQRLSLQQMQEVTETGAFAITIEPKGGSESPNLEQLVGLGPVG